MTYGFFGLGICENRCIHLKISENLKALGKDTVNTYVQGPVDQGNYAQAGLGVPAGGVRAVLEAGDAIFEGVLDRELDFETQNRIIRDVEIIGKDTAAFVGNTLSLRWGKALRNAGGVGLAALRTPQSVVMEVIDQGGGYDVYRGGTRASINDTLSTAA